MLRRDEDALVCDFAEAYRVLDWRGLPLRLAATLAAGLRPEARSWMRLTGTKAKPDTLLLAAAVDALRVLIWQQTKDGAQGVNRPGSVLAELLGEDQEETGAGFESVEAYDAWRAGMI